MRHGSGFNLKNRSSETNVATWFVDKYTAAGIVVKSLYNLEKDSISKEYFVQGSIVNSKKVGLYALQAMIYLHI